MALIVERRINELKPSTIIPDSSRDLHYLAKSLLLAVPAISIGIQIPTWIGFALSDLKNHADFGTFYRAGWLVRTSQIDKLYPTNPPTFDFIHPAYEAPLFVPLTFLQVRPAQIAWMLVNLLILGLIIYLLRDHVRHMRSARLLPMVLALAFFPVSYAIAQGQDSLLLTLLITLAFLKMKSCDEFSAGILLGLGAFRFQFLAPIAILFLAWKMWKSIAGMISGALCALLASIALTGISGQLQYAKMLRLLAQPASQPVHRMSSLRAVLFAWGIESPLMVVIVSAVVIAIVAWLGRCPSQITISDICGNTWVPSLNPFAYRLLFAVTATCLLSYHFFMHDMSVLVVPLIMLADAAISNLNYQVLVLLGAAILAPEVIILAGSADAMWVCAIVPILLLLAIKIEKLPVLTLR
jgi:hypothetical protein